MVLFLASGKARWWVMRSGLIDDPCFEDESSYVNGQNIAVDGGLSSSHPVIPGHLA